MTIGIYIFVGLTFIGLAFVAWMILDLRDECKELKKDVRLIDWAQDLEDERLYALLDHLGVYLDKVGAVEEHWVVKKSPKKKK